MTQEEKLFDFCKTGDYKLVTKLLRRKLFTKGININAKDKFGMTPLQNTIINREKDVARLLISKGADVNETNKTELSPILLAIKQGDEGLVELLTEKGADLKTPNEDGDTPILLAIKRGRKDIAELLIEKGANVNSSNYYGYTPILLAIEHGFKDLVELLIKKGADVNASNKLGQTPVHFSITQGRKDIAKLLIEKGANVTSTNKDGQTAIFLALKDGDKDLIELLIEKGANLKIKDKVGFSPFLWALYDWHREMNFRDFYERNKVFQVFKTQLGKITRLLVTKGLNLNDIDIHGNSLLRWSVFYENEEMFEILIANGANVNNGNFKGETPLSLAFENSNYMMAELLISNGANLNTIQDIQFNPDGDTLLHRSVKRNNLRMTEILISNCAEINFANLKGETPLMLAVDNNNYELAELLISNGSGLNAIKDIQFNPDGDTLLHTAVKRYNLRMTELLISKGIDVIKKNSIGMTPLHCAKDLEIAKMLINNGADIDAIDNNGRIPDIMSKLPSLKNIESTFQAILLSHGERSALFHSESVEFDKLINGYIEHFKRCTQFHENIERYDGRGDNYSEKYQYDFKFAILAIEELSNFGNRISSNLLHLLQEINDKEVITYRAYDVHDDETHFSKGTLSYAEIRNKALEELNKRGNPPYDSNVFMDKKEYEII